MDDSLFFWPTVAGKVDVTCARAQELFEIIMRITCRTAVSCELKECTVAEGNGSEGITSGDEFLMSP